MVKDRVWRKNFKRDGKFQEPLLVFIVAPLAWKGMDESFQAVDGCRQQEGIDSYSNHTTG